jgi:hypothetical protein
VTVNNSTNVNKGTITSHNSLNIKKIKTYDVGKPGPDIRAAGLNQLMGSQHFPLLRQDNYKQTIQSLNRLASNHKTSHTITNMNNNINMNSTKASSVNARS